MIVAGQPKPWTSLALNQTRWQLTTTWRNGEQLLLLIGLPLLALVALTRTDVISSPIPPVVTTATMVVLAAGFTSPAITLAFERRYGTFALLATTPLPRTALIAGTLLAVAASSLLAVGVMLAVAALMGSSAAGSAWVLMGTVALGSCAVVPWAFVVGGTVRAESALVVANGIFVVAVLFGGALAPITASPLATVVAWLPPAAVVELAGSSTPSSALQPAGVLIGWAVLGTSIAVRMFRWR